MEIVTIHRAKTELSRLIEKACRGEEIVIARGKEPGGAFGCASGGTQETKAWMGRATD
jgi:hypothetical protein